MTRSWKARTSGPCAAQPLPAAQEKRGIIKVEDALDGATSGGKDNNTRGCHQLCSCAAVSCCVCCAALCRGGRDKFNLLPEAFKGVKQVRGREIPPIL